MKVAVMSNSPWAGTGYGQQVANLLPRLLDRYGPGNVACLSNYGLQGAMLTLDGIVHYPAGYHPYSDDVGPHHAHHFFGGDDGWVITLFDTWVFENPNWLTLNVAAWTPVDHAPVPAKVTRIFTELGAVPVAMSQFGQRELAAAGHRPLYVPHSIDTAVFCPGGRAEGRAALGVPDDAWLVGMVAANKGAAPPRKGWGEAFRAFALLARFHDDAHLYVHSDPSGVASGVDLRALADHVGIPGGRFHVLDAYSSRHTLPAQMMAAVYRAFDVLLAPSYGEGFGIPVVEAQACGVPVVVTDATAQPELVGAGAIVPGQAWVDPAFMADYTIPNLEQLTYALHQLHERDGDTVAADARTARAKAIGYDNDTVWRDYWCPVLDELEARTPSLDPVAAVPV